MNRLILVKHSLPEIVPAISPNQWKLSERGRARCEMLAEKIGAYLPDIVVSSLEPKAFETAQILARLMNKAFHTFEGLQEHDRTGVPFLSYEQFEANVKAFFARPVDLVMGKETAHQACERFSKALESVEAEHPNKNIVVVSHGTVITLFVQKVTGWEPLSLWKRLDLPSFMVFELPEYNHIATVESVV